MTLVVPPSYAYGRLAPRGAYGLHQPSKLVFSSHLHDAGGGLARSIGVNSALVSIWKRELLAPKHFLQNIILCVKQKNCELIYQLSIVCLLYK